MQAPKVHLKHNVIKPKSLHESEIESLNVTMIEDTSFDKSLPGTPKLISLVVNQKHVSMRHWDVWNIAYKNRSGCRCYQHEELRYRQNRTHIQP